jgi:hypothetical protein
MPGNAMKNRKGMSGYSGKSSNKLATMNAGTRIRKNTKVTAKKTGNLPVKAGSW